VFASDDVLVADGVSNVVVVTEAEVCEPDVPSLLVVTDAVVGVSRLLVVAGGDVFGSDHVVVVFAGGKSVVVVLACFEVTESGHPIVADCA